MGTHNREEHVLNEGRVSVLSAWPEMDRVQILALLPVSCVTFSSSLKLCNPYFALIIKMELLIVLPDKPIGRIRSDDTCQGLSIGPGVQEAVNKYLLLSSFLQRIHRSIETPH